MEDHPDLERLCPACGFELWFKPWTEVSGAADEICPSCGIQFGYDDAMPTTRHDVYRRWREQWVLEGMPWFSGQRRPASWDPGVQLARVEGT